MNSHTRYSIALVAAIVLIGCGDDDPTGPQFGDLQFSESQPVVLGAARDTTASIRNVSGGTVADILVGGSPAIGQPPLDAEDQCPVQTTVQPAFIATLAPGASVELDISIDDTDPAVAECLAGSYKIEIVASAGGTSLANMSLVISVNE